ncbi:MAG: rhodanese-like domain-containing protein [Alphaproteobacteria bacterium]|mgnify:FL=1|nr:MAG: rhodanese-like domain-containing protein [Alphaproteobacteria bacterium]|tara:strand:- start:598 stop:1014 length:417 start_codon:yes stop_codon:yes gene_type:complete
MKTKRITSLLFLSLFLFANFGYAEIKNIGNSEIKRLMSLGIPLIDVRRRDEWISTGVIENSYLHTFFDINGKYDLESFITKIKKISNSEKGIILFCRSGRRTTAIAETLEKTNDFPAIYNTKGIKAWILEDNNVIKYQ